MSLSLESQTGERARISRSAILRFSAAGGAVAVALGTRLVLDPILDIHAPYVPFSIAIIVAARFGGTYSGYWATVLSMLATVWFFLEPRYSLSVGNLGTAAGLALFSGAGLAISYLVGSLQAALASKATAESALRRQLQLVDLSHDAIITLDRGWRITGWNNGARELYGWSESEALGNRVYELLQAGGDLTRDQISDILHRERRWEGELDHTARDGRRLRVESRHVLLEDGEDGPTILEINRDVTARTRFLQERRHAEEALRRQGEFLDAVVTHAPYPIAVLKGRELRFTLANAAYQALAATDTPVLGRPYREVFPEAAAAGAEASLLGTLETGEPWIIDHLQAPAPGGAMRIWDGKVVRLPLGPGEEPSILVVAWDATEQVEQQQAIREREAMLDAFFAASPGILNLFDAELRYLNSDPVTPTYFGLDRQSIVGKSTDDLNAPTFTQRLAPILRRVSDSGSPELNLEFSAPLPERSGEPAYFRGSYFPVPLPGGRRGVGAIALDITDSRRAEEALRRRTAELDSLLANAPLGFAYFDREHRYIRINEQLCAINGLSEQVHIGRPISDVLPVNALTVDPILDEVFTTGRAVEREVVGETPREPGVTRSWLTGFYPVFDEAGAVSSVGAFVFEITERKQMEQRLREALAQAEEGRALLDALMEHIPLGITIADAPDVKIRRVSRFGRELIGKSNEEITEISAEEQPAKWEVYRSDGVTPASADELPLTRAVRFGEIVTGEEWVVCSKQGTKIPILCTAAPIRDFEGRVSGGVIGWQDITSLKQTEQALRASEARLARTQEFSHVMALHVSLEGRWLKLPPTFVRFLGYESESELLGRPFQDVTHPDDFQADWSQVERLVRGEIKSFELEKRFIRKGGSVTWGYLNCSIVSDEAGNPVHLLTYVRDINVQKQAEEALRQSEERFRALFEFMQEGFAVGEVILDEQGNPADWRYVQLNDAMARMLRLRRDEIIGRTYRELFPHADWRYWVENLGRVALSGEPAHLDHYGSGSGRHYQAIAYSAAPGQFATVFTDVTESKKAEERIREAQKLDSVGLLAGGVAHDFNNLLTVIMGSASAALEECPACEHSRAIVEAADRAAHLTKQLLAYAGKGRFVKKAVDLTTLVSESKDLLKASVSKRVELVFDLASGLPAVEEDPTRVEQILMNLVINAGEAIPPKTDGRVTIATGRSEISPEVARDQSRCEVSPGSYVWLEVRDNGTGMDAATQSRIFDPFFSTKFTGRGLGLAAVDGIVRSGNGFIDVRSAPGGGASFRVYLPATGAKAESEAAPEAQAPQPRASATVLVVDDEEMVRKLAGVILRRHGFEVLEAHDGKHALQVLAEAPSLPALVLLDLAMPVMGGDELLPILLDQYPAIKILVSSGYPEEEARNAFRDIPVAGFLQKPYTAVTLTNRVDELLGGGPWQNGRVIQFPRFG